MALSADTAPHFTTIADFIASLEAQIVSVFRDVLLVCDEVGLIGREMFAVDGVKLPSNASKEWSGTRADFEKKAQKMERAIGHLLARHREADATGEDARLGAARLGAARVKQIETLQAAVDKVRGFVRCCEDKRGPSGRINKSKLTDNESAKMKTSKGVIQGYTGGPWSMPNIRWWCTPRPSAKRKSTDCSLRCWRTHARAFVRWNSPPTC